MTGATGFIGSFLVPELLGAGHRVVGLSRSEAGAATLTRAGAEVVRGDLNDLDRLRRAAEAADGVTHTAFDHGATNLAEGSESDRTVVAALGDALGPGRPLLISSGTALARTQGRVAVETDEHVGSEEYPRAATEEAADALGARGIDVITMRLSQVHDTRRQGRIGRHVALAGQHGRVAYVGDGGNRVPAVHVSDAVRLYRLALENGRVGARYHAVDEEGVALRDIAEVLGAGLGLPVESITPDEAPDYFGPLAGLAALDLPASSALTRHELGWRPTGPGLLTDLRALDHDAA
ncbi:SDR family oxidoreductase [Actinomycetospora sp.]|uniref:SDR family oxidoreductase n=1 Tax=Actinomycetospora sp. TaxID=1872135 RepID=UPI002F420AD8